MALLDEAPLLEARLRAICTTAGDNIFQTEGLAGVKERSQVTPALHLVLAGYQPKDDDAGDTSLWKTTWLVVAVVKNQRQGVGARAVREASPAAALLKEVIAALDGWRCPGTVGRVRAIPPPGPLITDGFGYFPLAFAVESVTDGAPFEDL